MPWDAIGHGISGIASIINTKQTNEANLKIARETNEANRQMVEAQNKAAAQEAEKAYNRSKASNQVSLMQSAGMSRAGAINALNGGGSYTPAPVNTSQDSAPQMQAADFSAFSNMAQAITADKQMKQNEKLAKMQIKASAEAQKAQFEENEKQRKHDSLMKDVDTANQTQHDYVEYEKHRDRLKFDREQFNFNKSKVYAEINYIKKNTEVLKTVIKGNNLDNIRKEFENKQMPELARLATAKAWQDIQYVAQRMAHENADAMNKQERDLLELEFYRATMDSRINLENLQNELQAYLSANEFEVYNSPIGSFIGALTFCMDNLVPKFAIFK